MNRIEINISQMMNSLNGSNSKEKRRDKVKSSKKLLRNKRRGDEDKSESLRVSLRSLRDFNWMKGNCNI